MQNLKIIFVSHNASRTGAPILLINLLRWFKMQSVEMRLLLLNGGELEDQFTEIAPVMHLTKVSQSKLISFARRVSASFSRRLSRRLLKYHLHKFIDDFNPDIIYANTAVSAAFLRSYTFIKKYRVLCHLHELEIAINEFAGKEAFVQSIPLVGKFICASRAVKQNLLNNYEVKESQTIVIPEPIMTPAVERSIHEIRNEIDVPLEAFVVCGGGTTEWRKGFDLFILTAYEANKLSKTFFVWIGYVAPLMLLKIQHDLERLGLTNFVKFIGNRDRPLDYFAACDVFFLSSREDPYPLVCLEAASQAKPIVCFRDAGGIPEFVQEDGGFIVPYLDLKEAASKLLILKTQPELRARMGKVVQERVLNNSIVSIVGQRILELLTSMKNQPDLQK